jgi:hypothetical protein
MNSVSADLYKIGLFAICFSIYSCNSPVQKDNSKNLLTNDSVSNTVFVDKYIIKFLLKDSVIKKINKPIDSSNLIKAFNNIYFGEMEDNSEPLQQIGHYDYQVVDKNFDEKFGLYQFGLKSTEWADLDNAFNEIDKIVSGLYEKQFIINEDGTTRPNLNLDRDYAMVSKESGKIYPEIPEDWGNILFIKQYETTSKILKVGYEIDYSEVYARKKVSDGDGHDRVIEDKENVVSLTKYYRIYLRFIHIKTLLERNRIQQKIKEKEIATDQSKF